MAFIAQFDRAAVAPHDREGILPARGLLSFFYETDGEPLYSAGWGLPEETPPEQYPEIDPSLGWRVLYHEGDPTTFVRRDIPPALNESARFPPCAARVAAEMTLPDADGPEVEPLRLSGAERSALIALDVDVIRGTWGPGGHHLLGHSYNLGGSTLADCEVAARRIPCESLEVDSARWKELARQAARRWRLLLQVESSDEAEMDWGGGGLLHFCIEREALRARDFSRVWLNMQVI
jgi:hypothetical protein